MIRAVLLVGFGIVIGVSGISVVNSLLQHFSQPTQPYAGQDQRTVSSLSAKDIDDLRHGRGWGLAKPAELNGYPGPLHILELEEDLSLHKEQRDKIAAAFDQMRTKAIALGRELIAAETAIDEVFRNRDAAVEELQVRLNRAAQLRGKLRAVHLEAHIQVTPVLDDAQRKKYALLRGYDGGEHKHGGH